MDRDNFSVSPILIGKASGDLTAGKGDDVPVPVDLLMHPSPNHVALHKERICSLQKGQSGCASVVGRKIGQILDEGWGRSRRQGSASWRKAAG